MFSCFKHITALIFLSVLLLFSISIPRLSPLKAEEIIRIGYFNLPPQVFLHNGKVQGIAVDYWEKHIAPEMGVKIKWYGPYNIKRLVAQAKKGKLDAILILAKNAQRQKIVNYPENGFYKMTAGILMPRNHKIQKIESFKSLQGMKLCFFAGGFIPPVVRKVNIEWVLEYKSDWTKRCMQKTAINDVDGVFNLMKLSLQYSNRLYKFHKHSKILPIPDLTMPVYTAFSGKADQTLIKRYEAIHDQLLKKGIIDTIISSYLAKK